MEPNVGWTEALGAFAKWPEEPKGVGEPIIYKEKTYLASEIDGYIKVAFEIWLRDAAKRAIEEEDDEYEKREMRRDYIRMKSSGTFDWGGDIWQESLSGGVGLYFLFFLMLKRNHPSLTKELSDLIANNNLEETFSVIGWALGNLKTSERKTREETDKDFQTQLKKIQKRIGKAT